MKKMSFAALMTCVLLALTVVAGAYALSPDNNIILAAINNAVTTLQNSITDAQNDINAHTDALATKSLLINTTSHIDPDSYIEIELLSQSEGKTYSGHITMLVYLGDHVKTRVMAYIPSLNSSMTGYYTLGEVEPDPGGFGPVGFNADFSGLGLRLIIVNSDADESRSVYVYGVLQYTISTDVGTLTLP